jgi:hypothetical protein
MSAIEIFRQSAEAGYSEGDSSVGQNPNQTCASNAFEAHPNDVCSPVWNCCDPPARPIEVGCKSNRSPDEEHCVDDGNNRLHDRVSARVRIEVESHPRTPEEDGPRENNLSERDAG